MQQTLLSKTIRYDLCHRNLKVKNSINLCIDLHVYVVMSTSQFKASLKILIQLLAM